MLDKIVSIELVGEEETVDIDVSGDHLFYANDILVHNSAQNSSDIDLEHVAESHGLAATCDLMLALINTEELEKLDQIMVKQLKNRYNDVSKFRRFVIGVDKSHMRIYDVDQQAQEDIADSGQAEDTPAFDKTKFGDQMLKRKDYNKIKVQ